MLSAVVEEINRIRGMADAAGLKEDPAKLSMVLPILQALGWDYKDPKEVRSEYKVGLGSADLALFLDENPLILVEIKAPNQQLVLEKNEKQMFDYCGTRKMKHVQIGVLTNGLQWRIYYLADDVENENYSFVDSIDIRDGIAEDSAKKLDDLLSKRQASDKSAFAYAKHLWHCQILSVRWKNLLESGGGAIVHQLYKAKDKDNVVIGKGDIKKFLKDQVNLSGGGVTAVTVPDVDKPVVASPPAPSSSVVQSRPAKTQSGVRAEIFGVVGEYKSYKAVFLAFIQKASAKSGVGLKDLEQRLQEDSGRSVVMVYGAEKARGLFRHAKQIGDTDYWIETSLSANDIGKRCGRIARALSLPANSINFR